MGQSRYLSVGRTAAEAEIDGAMRFALMLTGIGNAGEVDAQRTKGPG
jgi:hypothetical protein